MTFPGFPWPYEPWKRLCILFFPMTVTNTSRGAARPVFSPNNPQNPPKKTTSEKCLHSAPPSMFPELLSSRLRTFMPCQHRGDRTCADSDLRFTRMMYSKSIIRNFSKNYCEADFIPTPLTDSWTVTLNRTHDPTVTTYACPWLCSPFTRR